MLSIRLSLSTYQKRRLVNKIKNYVQNSTLLRYILVGGTSFALEILILLIFIKLLNVNESIAVSIGFWSGLIISFILQKFFAFKDNSVDFSRLSTQTIYYGVLVLINYVFTLLFTLILTPIFGLIVSRTLALIITTCWNYIIYKKVIFNRKIASSKAAPSPMKHSASFIKKYPLVTISILVSGFFLSSLVIMALLNQMVADDYSYFYSISNSATPFHYIFEHYMTHNGRLSQASFVAISYGIFGSHIVKLVPVFIIFAMTASLSWLVYLVFKFKNNQAINSIVSGSLMTLTSLLALPSLFDSLFWVTSSTVYMLSIIALVTNVCLVIVMRNKPKINKILLGIILFGMALSQSFSEPTSAVAIGLTVVWVGYEVIKKNKNNIKLSLQVLLSLIIGFLVVFLSPGSRLRQSSLDSRFNIAESIVKSFGYIPSMIEQINPWVIGFILFTSLFIAVNTKRQKRSRIPLVIASVLILLSFTIGTFFVSNSASNCCELRTLSLPTVGIVVSLTTLSVILIKLTLSSRLPLRKYLIAALVCCILMVFASSLFSATKLIVDQIRNQSIRETLVMVQKQDIKDQLSSDEAQKTETIYIKAAPIITQSQAVDINGPGSYQTDWLISSYRSYYGIPKNYKIIYIETPDSYCSNNTLYTKYEYICR